MNFVGEHKLYKVNERKTERERGHDVQHSIYTRTTTYLDVFRSFALAVSECQLSDDVDRHFRQNFSCCCSICFSNRIIVDKNFK